MKRWGLLKNEKIEFFTFNWELISAEEADNDHKDYAIFHFDMGKPKDDNPKLHQYGKRYMKYGSFRRIRIDHTRRLFLQIEGNTLIST